MEWLTQNWTWLLLIGAMVAMHLFGHRGHGGHGAHGKHPGAKAGCGSSHGRSDRTTADARREAGHEGHSG